MTEFWFDTRDGSIYKHVPSAESGTFEIDVSLVSLKELLTTKDFSYNKDSFKPSTEAVWDRESMLALGRWVLDILNAEQDEHEAPLTIKQEHIFRLNLLRIGPSRENVDNEFGSTWQYREALGEPTGYTPFKYQEWTHREFVEYAAGLADSLGRKPIREDYITAFREGKGPGVRLIYEKVGSIGALNEDIGYPNIKAWDENDFIHWGADVMQANNGMVLTTGVIEILSVRQAGPACATIKSHFGGSMIKFQGLVEQELQERQDRQQAKHEKFMQIYEQLRSDGILGERFDKLSFESKIAVIAKYLVVKKVLPECPPSDLANFSRTKPENFFRFLISFSERQITAGSIELAAFEMGVLDDIWPNTIIQKRLKVNKNELSKKYAHQRKRQRRIRERQKRLQQNEADVAA